MILSSLGRAYKVVRTISLYETLI